MQILAAPIQEYTTASFRNAHGAMIGGIEEYYAPFVRLERGKISARSLRDLVPENNRVKSLVPQILVKSGQETDSLLQMLEEWGYFRVDFNFCCPFIKVVDQGYGAGILENSIALQEVLARAGKFPHLRFSAKLRLGNQTAEDLNQLISILNDFPFQHLVLHPRTAVQGYKGAPDRQAFVQIEEKLIHPIFYNGDITQIDGGRPFSRLMLGRGLLSNPLLSLELLSGRHFPLAVRREKLQAFHVAYVEECQKLEQQPLLKLKLLWDYFLPETDKRLLKRIRKSRSLADYLTLAQEAIQSEGNAGSSSTAGNRQDS